MISQIRWLQESEPVRAKLTEQFNLVKSGGRTVENNKLVSDGISGEELYTKFSVKALQDFTGITSTDVYELFAVAVEIAKAEIEPKKKNEEPISKENAPAGRPATVNDAGTATKAKGRRGRPKKESAG